MIPGEIEPLLGYALSRRYPTGPDCSFPHQGKTHSFVEDVVNCLDIFLKKLGSSVSVALATSGKASPTNIRGLIIHFGGTTVVKMKVTPNLVQLGKTFVYVGCPDGAASLLRAILHEVEKACELRVQAA